MFSTPDLSLFGTTLQVFLIDLLLSGDNAVVIALACRSLPPRARNHAILMGVGAAILLRVILTLFVNAIMVLPGLKLVGSFLLIIIAIKLVLQDDESEEGNSSASRDFWTAVLMIVLADLTMSLDNVVALAAVARGSVPTLLLGLGLSVPLLMFGSVLVGKLLERYPLLITGGGALLGWIAGDIATSDSLIADFVNTQAQALLVFLPPIGAIFVLLEARILGQSRPARPQSARPQSPNSKPTPAPQPRPQQAPAPQPTPPKPRPAPPAPTTNSGDDGGETVLASLSALLKGLFAKSPDAERELSRHIAPPLEQAEEAGVLILVAEDDAEDRAVIANSLNWLGYAVETAVDGREALDMLTNRRYGLLLTDCYMPRLDGYKLTAAVRDLKAEPPLPVVALVGRYIDGTIRHRCTQAGMDDCISKPVTLDALDRAVEQWLPAALPLRRPLDEKTP